MLHRNFCCTTFVKNYGDAHPFNLQFLSQQWQRPFCLLDLLIP
jgi:hypothetical protein